MHHTFLSIENKTKWVNPFRVIPKPFDSIRVIPIRVIPIPFGPIAFNEKQIEFRTFS